MKFSLRTLLLVMAVVPPIAWIGHRTLLAPPSDEPLQLPDPIGLIGVVAWITIFYNCVYKRLPTSFEQMD